MAQCKKCKGSTEDKYVYCFRCIEEIKHDNKLIFLEEIEKLKKSFATKTLEQQRNVLIALYNANK